MSKKAEQEIPSLDTLLLDACILMSVLSSDQCGPILEMIKGDVPNFEDNYDLLNAAIDTIKRNARVSTKSRWGKKNNLEADLIISAEILRDILYARWANEIMNS